ncbi:MAG: glycosyltransferase family 4 protein [Chloroflexi bacterium]|nr:glycosyltransferase family 4 protein [Chloroflexota bacterium]
MFSRIMPSHAPGGMQDHVLTLSLGLARKGHAVTVISSGRADGVDYESIEGVEVHYLPGTPPGQNTNAYWYGAARKLQALQPVSQFEILHSQSVGAFGVYRRRLNRQYRLPLVTSFHGTHLDVLTTSWHTDFSLTSPLGTARFIALALNLLFRYAYRDVWFTRGSDVVIATSDSDVGKYKMLYGLRDAQIRKVYNGIDTVLFSPRDDRLAELRQELRLDPSEKVILALARLEKDKGVQVAVAVMPRLLGEKRVCLIVVGDGDYRPALEAQARRLGVSDHVRFVGAKSLAECARYFNLCDVFVDPTLRTDGYDLTIAEAMACAKPVIASDVGANSTLVDAAARNGVLIPRGDDKALAREIRILLDAPALRAELGATARAKIEARFSIEAMVDGMEHVYAELLSA